MPDFKKIRSDFPILSEKTESGQAIVYLDSAASSQKPQAVLDRVQKYYSTENANVHRGLHYLADKATSAYEAARKTTADFINAPSTDEIIFTRGTSESINLIAYAWGDKFISEGDEIMLSVSEHHSNIVPWQQLAQRKKAELKYIPITSEGELDLAAFEKLLSDRVKMVSVTHASNVLGNHTEVKTMVDKAHALGAVVSLDAAQTVPHMPVDVQELGVDFLSFSGHKMCGPTGIGVLYGKRDILLSMDPFLSGGEMINKVELDHSTWADLPYKFEAGTPNIAGAIGLGAAIDYISKIGMENIHQRVEELSADAMAKLSTISGLTIYGPKKNHGGAVSFSIEGIHPHDLSQILDQQGIAIRAGHLCCQPLMDVLKVSAVNRASYYLYNNEGESDALIEGIYTAKKIFGVT